jgi:hypothetical protein
MEVRREEITYCGILFTLNFYFYNPMKSNPSISCVETELVSNVSNNVSPSSGIYAITFRRRLCLHNQKLIYDVITSTPDDVGRDSFRNTGY